MKKMMTVLAACAIASFSLAAGDVTSANVVGYKANVAVNADNFTMVGVPFRPISGGGTPIASLFADNTSLTAGETELLADTLLVWNGSGYTHYFYSSDAGSPGAWSINGFDVTTDAIPAGGAFWFRRVGAAINSLTISGEVIKTNITCSVAANDFTMIGNPFAASVPISSITGASLTAGETELLADTLLVWTGGGYTHYFYSSDAGSPGAWSINGFDVTTDSIPASGAFWIRRVGSATTVTLPVPYTL